MSQELGSFTPSPAGNKTLLLSGSFTPTYVEFWVGPRSGTTETSNLHSFGTVDITNGNSVAESNFTDGTGSQTKGTSASCIFHYNRVAGAITKVIDITYVSNAAGQLTVNIGTASTLYTVFFKACA